MLKHCIEKLLKHEDLTAEEVAAALQEMLADENSIQSAAFISLLKAKGETVDEVYGLAKTMQANMRKIDCGFPVLDLVGTGGDGQNTINISTGSAILAASCGVKVAKHGNRSVSSRCGSADVLDNLGVNINLDSNDIINSIAKNNFGFCYAANFHNTMFKLKQLRKQLGVATIFNLLGPLLNPAQAEYLMIGVANPQQLTLMAKVVAKLNIHRCLVFHGCGLDEISTVGKIDMIEISDNHIERFQLNPQDYGFAPCSIEDLQGGSVSENAEILGLTLLGKPGPVADTLILNAGIACYIYGITNSIQDGIELARHKHKQGVAYNLLDQIIRDTYLLPKQQEVCNA